jgi:RNA recognition motif-containing protein
VDFAALEPHHDPIPSAHETRPGPYVPPGQGAIQRDTAFIGGIPYGTTQAQVRAAFAAYRPTQVRIVKTALPGATFGGFAFVTFGTEEDKNRAIRENSTIRLIGGTSAVKVARTPQSGGRERESGGRGRESGGRGRGQRGQRWRGASRR